jgi:uncharacterized membrane protein
MAVDNTASSDQALFSAMLTPHRSLGMRGFAVVMGLLAGLSLIPGVVFFSLGAWPVAVFLGLDLVLVFLAFRANYRAGAAYEQVTLTLSELKVRRVSHLGLVREWRLNPLWVRLVREGDEEFGLQRLFVVSRGRRFPIAKCLAPVERESFAAALSAAIGKVRGSR